MAVTPGDHPTPTGAGRVTGSGRVDAVGVTGAAGGADAGRATGAVCGTDAGVVTGAAGVTPADRSTPMLLVDGDCGFCMRAAGWLAQRTSGLTLTTLQSVDVVALGLDPVAVSARLHAVTGRDVRVGAAAVAVGLRCGSWPMRAAAAVLDAPGVRVLAQWGYDVVARNRHRLPGGTAACELPSAQGSLGAASGSAGTPAAPAVTPEAPSRRRDTDF